MNERSINELLRWRDRQVAAGTLQRIGYKNASQIIASNAIAKQPYFS